MTKRFEFDSLRYVEISFEHFCENFQQLLVDMRSNLLLCDLEENFEFETGNALIPVNINERDIFKLAREYEGFLQSQFINESYDLVLPNEIVSIYSEIEMINGIQNPWFSVGVFNEELNTTRKKLLVCKNPADETANYWRLSESTESSPDNIPIEFRLIANKLRASINL